MPTYQQPPPSGACVWRVHTPGADGPPQALRGRRCVVAASRVEVLGGVWEPGPGCHGDGGAWSGPPRSGDLSHPSGSVLRTQPLEPEEGQRAGLPGVWSRCGHTFPAKGLWASGAPAKPAACGHVLGRPCTESGLCADSRDAAGTGLAVSGSDRAALWQRAHAQSTRDPSQQRRPSDALLASRVTGTASLGSGPRRCRVPPGFLPESRILSRSWTVLGGGAFSRTVHTASLCAQEGRVRVCVSGSDIRVSTALCSAPSGGSAAQGRGLGALRPVGLPARWCPQVCVCLKGFATQRPVRLCFRPFRSIE